MFIKAHRDSDACHYCKSYKIIRKKLITLHNSCKTMHPEIEAEDEDDIMQEMRSDYSEKDDDEKRQMEEGFEKKLFE